MAKPVEPLDLGGLQAVAIRTDRFAGPVRTVLHAGYDAAWLFAGIVGLPWFLWKSRRVPGLFRMLRDQLGRGLPRLGPKSGPRILVHGVSVGEVKGAQSLVRAIEAACPGAEVVISATTNTGIQVAGSLFPGNAIVRYPADLSWVTRGFLRRVRPDWVVLVELEIWPNFLRECNIGGVPVAVINGRITERSHKRYLVFRRLLPQFNRISLFCVQSAEYAERFADLGVSPERILITGNVKVDGLRLGAVEPGEELGRLLGSSERLVVVAGSTHAPEEVQLAQAWRRAIPGTRLILVPRHPQRCEEIERRLEDEGFAAQRLSALRRGAEPDPARPALVDTIGELERIYALADLVFVGGSLVEHGGQNVLEPAAQGKATLFGPSVTNFAQEAALLLSCGGARQVRDVDGLVAAWRELVLADDAADRRRAMGAAALAAVASQGGATGLTLEALQAVGLFDPGVGESRAPC